ncbi:MAG: conjugal transfer protein TraR [Ignavibacteria bacterium]|nr:conjugal transfer protein TraR [Ignavibacteria bacterium]
MANAKPKTTKKTATGKPKAKPAKKSGPKSAVVRSAAKKTAKKLTPAKKTTVKQKVNARMAVKAKANKPAVKSGKSAVSKSKVAAKKSSPAPQHKPIARTLTSSANAAKSAKPSASHDAKKSAVKKPAVPVFNYASTTLKPLPTVQHKQMKKYKKNKKVRYTVAELRHFRNLILEEQKSILESARANMEALVDKESGEYKGDNLTYASHMAEQGTDEMEREKNYMFVQRDEKYLGYLQDALIRIDQGTYGICIDCKDEPKNYCKTCPLIPKERLEVVPITTHCIECKNLRG